MSLFLNFLDFNTSYVVIKPVKDEKVGYVSVDFNTSYVVIKLKSSNSNPNTMAISIHLMLLLNTGNV